MHTISTIWITIVLLVMPEAPPALVVTLRDTQGAPMVGVEVLAYDRTGSALFARAMTDARGMARIDTLPGGDIRVLVRGRAGGVELHHVGDDTRGVLVILGAPPTRLDLIVDAEGAVRPDPATMIIPDSDTALVSIATAIPAPTITLVAPTTMPATLVAEPSTVSFPWLGIVLIACMFTLLLVGLFWLRRVRVQ